MVFSENPGAGHISGKGGGGKFPDLFLINLRFSGQSKILPKFLRRFHKVEFIEYMRSIN